MAAALEAMVESTGARHAIFRLDTPGRPLAWARSAPGSHSSRGAFSAPPSSTHRQNGASDHGAATAPRTNTLRVHLDDGGPPASLELRREGPPFDPGRVRAMRIITRQLASHALLRRNQENTRETFLREVADEGPTIKHVYLPDPGVTVFANRACRHFLGVGSDDDAETNADAPGHEIWLRHVDESDRRLLLRQLTRTQRAPIGRALEGEHRFLRNGEIRHLHLWSTRLPDHETGPRGAILITALDETDKHALRAHVSRLQTSEKSELRRMIHDGICQDLIGLRMSLENVLEDVLEDESSLPDGVASELRSLRTALARSLENAREISRGIAPYRIERAALHQALHDILETTQHRFGVQCRLIAREPSSLLGDHDAQQLYWIAREAIVNAAKHADAETIHVALLERHGHLALRITDDGRGFDVDAPQWPRPDRSGQGLSILRRRAHSIDAELSIESSPGQGTVITCELDLDGNGDHDDA